MFPQDNWIRGIFAAASVVVWEWTYQEGNVVEVVRVAIRDMQENVEYATQLAEGRG